MKYLNDIFIVVVLTSIVVMLPPIIYLLYSVVFDILRESRKNNQT